MVISWKLPFFVVVVVTTISYYLYETKIALQNKFIPLALVLVVAWLCDLNVNDIVFRHKHSLGSPLWMEMNILCENLFMNTNNEGMGVNFNQKVSFNENLDINEWRISVNIWKCNEFW